LKCRYEEMGLCGHSWRGNGERERGSGLQYSDCKRRIWPNSDEYPRIEDALMDDLRVWLFPSLVLILVLPRLPFPFLSSPLPSHPISPPLSLPLSLSSWNPPFPHLLTLFPFFISILPRLLFPPLFSKVPSAPSL
jgi:hypothetical protein